MLLEDQERTLCYMALRTQSQFRFYLKHATPMEIGPSPHKTVTMQQCVSK
jgi:hypothetical protein